jgi:transposase-like protein
MVVTDEDFEKLLAVIGTMSPAQATALEAAIKGKLGAVLTDAASEPDASTDGPAADSGSIADIEASFAAAPRCPHCQSMVIAKWGTANGLKRYRCKACKATFNALTGTPLAQLHKRELWQEHAQALVDGIALRKVAGRIGVHLETAFRWRHRFLKAHKTVKPKSLQGTVEADETYFLHSEKGSRKLKRPAHKRGGKATKRGLSDEQQGNDGSNPRRPLDSIDLGRAGAGHRQVGGAGQRWCAGLPCVRRQGEHSACGAQLERRRACLGRLSHSERQQLHQPPQRVDAPLQRRRHQIPRQLSRMAPNERPGRRLVQRERPARRSLGLDTNINREQRQK